jgi:hypothetical protein
VPLSDKRAGWRILSRILPEFGVRSLAKGSVFAAVISNEGGLPSGDIIINYSPQITSNLLEATLPRVRARDKEALIEEINKRRFNARKSRRKS